MPALNPHPDDAAARSTRDDVAQAAAGDVAAFERIYRQHVPRVHSLARRMAGAAAADELTQDVFVRAWQKLGTFRGDSAFGTWLHRLAVNVIIERFRSLGAPNGCDWPTATRRSPSRRRVRCDTRTAARPRSGARATAARRQARLRPPRRGGLQTHRDCRPDGDLGRHVEGSAPSRTDADAQEALAMVIPMNADPWTDRLSEYVDDELAPAERLQLEQHLLDCARCREIVDELREVAAEAQDARGHRRRRRISGRRSRPHCRGRRRGAGG